MRGCKLLTGTWVTKQHFEEQGLLLLSSFLKRHICLISIPLLIMKHTKWSRDKAEIFSGAVPLGGADQNSARTAAGRKNQSRLVFWLRWPAAWHKVLQQDMREESSCQSRPACPAHGEAWSSSGSDRPDWDEWVQAAAEPVQILRHRNILSTLKLTFSL